MLPAPLSQLSTEFSLHNPYRHLQVSVSCVIRLTGIATLLFCLLLNVTGQTSADSTTVAPDAPGKISGRVTNDAGDPLAGIAVCLSSAYSPTDCRGEEHPPTTNASGDYQIVGIGAGLYSVYFHDPTYGHFDEYHDNVRPNSSGVITPILVTGNHINGLNASLTPAGKVTGTLMLPAANSYIQSGLFRLFAYSEDHWQMISHYQASSGQPVKGYEFSGLQPGEYRLCVEVEIRWENAVFPGSSDQECYHEVASGVENATSLVVSTGTTLSNINFLLGEETSSLGYVSGRVGDTSGKPLSGITVIGYLLDEDDSSDRLNRVETDGAGHYQFSTPLQGRHLLQFYDRTGQHGLTYYPDALTLAQATSISLSQSSNITNINVVLGASAHITGHVHYSSGDAPQRGQVTLLQQIGKQWRIVVPFSFDVDASTGLYQIGGLAAGVYRLQASDNQGTVERNAIGYYGGATLQDALDITFADGETKGNMEIILAQGLYEGMITGTVTTGWNGLPGMRVTFYRLTNFESESSNTPVKLLDLFTDATGSYSVSGLERASYSVQFSDPAKIYASIYAGHVQNRAAASIYVVDGSRAITNVNVIMQPAGSISGTVRAGDGTVVSGVTVYALWFNAKLNQWRQIDQCCYSTDGAGNYQIGGLLPDNYRLYYLDSLGRYKRFYYGSTDQIELAQTVEVKPATTTTGIDVVLPAIPKVYLPIILAPAPNNE